MQEGDFDPPVERWLEIRQAGGILLTVLHILSDWNKTVPGRKEYLEKTAEYRTKGINVVELDLLRSGEPVIPLEHPDVSHPQAGACYLIAISRGYEPLSQRELHTCPLRERLPPFLYPSPEIG